MGHQNKTHACVPGTHWPGGARRVKGSSALLLNVLCSDVSESHQMSASDSSLKEALASFFIFLCDRLSVQPFSPTIERVNEKLYNI